MVRCKELSPYLISNQSRIVRGFLIYKTMATKKLFHSDLTGNSLLCYGNYNKDIVITLLSSDLENRTNIILNTKEVKELIIELQTLIDKMNNNG